MKEKERPFLKEVSLVESPAFDNARVVDVAAQEDEAAEKIECLRYLENGIAIKMVVTEYMGVEIDTPEDLEKAAKLL